MCLPLSYNFTVLVVFFLQEWSDSGDESDRFKERRKMTKMKKCILSTLVGALAMLIAITVTATIHANNERPQKDYEHIDYVFTITSEECYVCGDNGDTCAFAYWGEDNVGIVKLNRAASTKHRGEGAENRAAKTGRFLNLNLNLKMNLKRHFEPQMNPNLFVFSLSNLLKFYQTT